MGLVMHPSLPPAIIERHQRLMAEAQRIIDLGRERDVTLRLTGGLAVRRYAVDLDFAEREYSDIDLVGLAREGGQIHELFTTLGYRENLHIAHATGNGQRQFFAPPQQAKAGSYIGRRAHALTPAAPSQLPSEHVDVFLDAMRMDHDLDMRGRLNLDDYAVSAADIALSKLQIFNIDEKDVHDLVTLFKDVRLSEQDAPGVLNLAHIVATCASDWGLYIDVMANIDLCLDNLITYGLSGNEYHRVEHGLVQLQELMNEESKTLRWRLRARIGRRMAWRSEVDETGRAPLDRPPATEPAGQRSPSGDT
jgi:hypothetical protein